MTAKLKAFAAFWYDFVVGDDWRVAVGVVVAFALTYALSRTAVPAWWLTPVVVLVLFATSVRRAMRRR